MQLIKRFLAGALVALALSFAAPDVGLAPLPAEATILFAGGEDIDAAFTGVVNISTTAGQFRSGYARLALVPDNPGSVVDPPSNRFTIPAFANQSTVWIHAETFQFNGTATTTSNQQAVGIFGSDGVRRILIRGTGTNGQVKISTRNTAGTITDLVTCTSGSWPVAALTKLDIFLHYAVSGEITLYAGGVQFCDFIGDVTTNSVTAVNQADFAATTTSASRQIDYSEIIVATTDTRSLNLFTCSPAANGTNMTWTGSFSNVNPNTINDAVQISTGSNAQIAEFTCPSLPAGSFTIPAVAQTIRLTIGSSGPQNFNFITRPATGSTDYDTGSTTAGTGAYANYQHVWSVSPATSSAWTPAEVTTGFNEGVESEP
jgi:hypothetical protein